MLDTLPAGVLDDLSSLIYLDLANNNLSTLPADVFSGAPGLRDLLLSGNDLNELPDSLFHGLASLGVLWLHGNRADPMLLEVSLVLTDDGKVKATVSSGTPFAIEVPLIVTNGTIDGDSTITIPAGAVESAAFTVTVDSDSATVDVGALPDPPAEKKYTSYWLETHPVHHGYKLKRSADLPLTVRQDS